MDNAYQQASVIIIIGNGVANGLPCADAVLVVIIGVRIYSSRARGRGGIGLEPLSFPCQHRSEVVCRVAGRVIGYALSIIGGELILPRGIAVGIGNGFLYRPERSRCIRVNLFIEQVAPAVVFIGYGSVIAVAGTVIQVLADELIGRIVNICSSKYLIVQANSQMFDSSRLINGLGIFPISSTVSQQLCSLANLSNLKKYFI